MNALPPPGSTVIIDHKSTSKDIEDGRPYWRSLRLDHQVSTYLTGARALGYEPVGALWDVIRKPRVDRILATPEADRKYTKATKKEPARLFKGQRIDDEPLAEYRARLRADIEGSPDAYYRRAFVVRMAEEERNAAEDAFAVSEQIAFAMKRESIHGWPRTPGACERYFRLCDYWPVCTGEASIDNDLLFRTGDEHEELSTPPMMGDGKRHLPLITSSGMTVFQRCAREYFYSYVLRRRTLKKADALTFGTLLHVGLEAWWKTVDLESVYKAVAQASDDEVSIVQVEELLRGYHARWITEPFDVLAVEEQFRAPLINPATGRPSRQFEMGGKIDAIARVTEASADELGAAS